MRPASTAVGRRHHGNEPSSPPPAFDADDEFSRGLHAADMAHLRLERKTGFEPATSSLARRRSTTELLPLVHQANTPLMVVPRGRVELPTPRFSVACSTT